MSDFRPPADPFDYHLYVGFTRADISFVRRLYVLIAASGIDCCLRYPLGEDPIAGETAELSNQIQDGVEFSEKCLLCITPAYFEDEWSAVEISAAIDKATIFDHSVVILLVGIDRAAIPATLQCSRHNMTTFELSFGDELLPSDEFLQVILHDELKLRILPKMPKKISGSTEAILYFNYLRFILPDFRNRMRQTISSMHAKADQGNRLLSLPQYVSRMLIVIPHSCCPPKTMEVEGRILHAEFVFCNVNCCGDTVRDCKMSLMKVIDDDQEYYFAGEFPCCLLTLYENLMDELTGMTEQQLHEERENFCDTLNDLLSNSDATSRQMDDEYKLIKWYDSDTSTSLYDCLLPVVRRDAERLRISDSCGTTYGYESMMEGRPTDDVHVLHRAPLEVYEQSMMPAYPLKRVPRGICAIINMVEPVTPHLSASCVGEELVDKLEAIFQKRFLFDVRSKITGRVSTGHLQQLMLDLSNAEHHRFDAFVCCLIARGRRGVVRTSDGVGIAIVDLAQYFSDTKCPGLQGKPRLFFVLNCVCDGEFRSAVSAPLQRISSDEQETVCNSTAGDGYNDENSSSVEMLEHDAMPSAVTGEHGELLIPSCGDFLMSYCTLTDSTAALYVDALAECLVVNKQIDRALMNAEERIRQRLDKIYDVALPKFERSPFSSSTAAGIILVFPPHELSENYVPDDETCVFKVLDY